jgi:hypothetical protein
MQDLLLHPSAAIRKDVSASAVYPFSKAGISVPLAFDTFACRASIDSQYFVQLVVRYHAIQEMSTKIFENMQKSCIVLIILQKAHPAGWAFCLVAINYSWDRSFACSTRWTIKS